MLEYVIDSNFRSRPVYDFLTAENPDICGATIVDDDAILGKLAREYNRNQQEIDRIRGELQELGPAFLELGRTLSELQAHNWEQEVIRQINVSSAALRINFSGRSSHLPLSAIEKTSRLVVELSTALENKKRMEKNLKRKGLGSIIRP